MIGMTLTIPGTAITGEVDAVDNTADADKPVSTAQQAEIDTKLDTWASVPASASATGTAPARQSRRRGRAGVRTRAMTCEMQRATALPHLPIIGQAICRS